MQDCAGGKEQQALEEGVVHCMIETCGDAESGAQTHRSENIAYLGDGVEGQQALEIVLG